VTAALGEYLILDLDRGGTGGFQPAHGMIAVHRVAVAGIRIDHERQVHHARDPFHRLRHVGQVENADVRQAQFGVRNACAGHIKRLKADVGCHARRQRIGHAGQQDRLARQHVLFEFQSGHHHSIFTG